MILLRFCYSICVSFDPGLGIYLEGDLDHLLGESEAEVRDVSGQMGSRVVAKKVFEEEPPQPMNEELQVP
ncbi:UNVERIFIED_CONTAM: hypothetical protein Sradi_0755100 [Sesamum radiatum]|uniref:Uncharacterized protein n=1 Tax=Sesamum radiatum TaxID=300843 RepID=A0AAW2VTV1_SESRA